MGTYIAFLRGINVTGRRKMKMIDLKAALSKSRLKDVVTYIQSGNLVFKTEISDYSEIESKIIGVISTSFGYDDVPVTIIDQDYLSNVILNNPFLAEDKDLDISRLLVTYLSEIPNTELVDNLEQMDFGVDRFVIKDKVVYLHCPIAYGNSKLGNNFFESKLKVQATTRNWKTTLKMLELSEG